MAALDNRIVIGPKAAPLVIFTNGSKTDTIALSKVGGIFGVDVVGNQLSIDQIQFIVQYGKPNGPGLTVYMAYVGPDGLAYAGPDGRIYVSLLYSGEVVEPAYISLRDLPYGTPVFWWNNNILIAAFYLKQVERIGRYTYRITAISGVGLLDALYHTGGIYTGQTFEAVAGEIIGNTFPYTIAPELASLPVYGWLPYDTRRNNLHQLLFEIGAAKLRDDNGEARFAFLSKSTPTAIPDSRVAFGGTVDYEAPASAAEVTEHSFFPTAADETVTVFDNTDGSLPASNTLVVFDEAPVYDLTPSGSLTISESGVNYAIVSGTGVLTAKKYTHTTRVVIERNAGATVENIKRVTDMTLVSAVTSQNVAKRVLAYYSQARRVRAKIALEGERCGMNLSLNDPYYEPMEAFLESADVNASGNLLANSTLVEGYTPTGQGNINLVNELLTGSGTWTSTFTGELTVVCIQAGGGGDGGGNGTIGGGGQSFDFYQSPYSSLTRSTGTGRGGKGGKAGVAGLSGKITITVINVTIGQQISYDCGSHGVGGAVGEAGTAGGETTFGAVSSATGDRLPNGYYDVVTGRAYGFPGIDGVAGGDGGDGGNGTQGQAGGSAGDNAGGSAGTSTSGSGSSGESWRLGGGGGGGASNIAPGGDGTNANTPFGPTLTGGYGGNGANAGAADTVDPLDYGHGGNGGNGGGGGGGNANYTITLPKGDKGLHASYSPRRAGYGLGTPGTDGADGCVILRGGG